MVSHNILVVDDEQDIRELIADILQDEGYATRAARNSEEAFTAVAESLPSAVILDIWLEESQLDGLGVLETLRRKYPHLPIIMISGHGNIETAISSIRMGAYDYIEKPFKEDRLLHVLRRALETAVLQTENAELRDRVQQGEVLIGESNAIKHLRASIERVAPTGSRIFLSGPSGSGKEVVARLIHKKSKRANAPFVAFSAAGLSDSKVEEELFGTEDAQLSGPARKIGVFERANGGTLFIDEITEVPMAIQARILRVLQDNAFERIGGTTQTPVDIRVISASGKDVHKSIRLGKFREDLFYRLNVVPLQVPALADRRDDIPLLAKHFLEQFSRATGMPRRVIADEAVALMQAYNWPGNVRQLKNVIEWIMIMMPPEAGDKAITTDILPKELTESMPIASGKGIDMDVMSMPLREAREMFERQYLMAQINRFGGNISRTSEFVEMERSALHRKLKSLRISDTEKANS